MMSMLLPNGSCVVGAERQVLRGQLQQADILATATISHSLFSFSLFLLFVALLDPRLGVLDSHGDVRMIGHARWYFTAGDMNYLGGILDHEIVHETVSFSQFSKQLFKMGDGYDARGRENGFVV